MEYPIEIIFSKRDDDFAIRLQVAAICICFDNGGVEAAALDEEDYVIYESVGPHSFINMELTGNLEISVIYVLGALIRSINNGGLKPLQLRSDIESLVDPINTWIWMSDLFDWCKTKGLEHGDRCKNYWDAELEISICTFDLATASRLRLENPNIVDLHNAAEKPIGYSIESFQVDEIISELKSEIRNLRMELLVANSSPTSFSRALGTRERDSLLKLVIGMAIDGYGFDPSAMRSPISRELANILATNGLLMDEDTVRKYLTEAVKAVLPGKSKLP